MWNQRNVNLNGMEYTKEEIVHWINDNLFDEIEVR